MKHFVTFDHQQQFEHVVPSIKKRMACWVYEGMLMFGVVFLAGYLFGTFSQTRHAMDNRHGLQVFLFLIFAIYFVWFWAKGQTLAMKTWHIRVVTLDGQALSQTHAFCRYVLSWMWFLPPLLVYWLLQHTFPLWGMAWMLFSWVSFLAFLASKLHNRQFLHDILARTQLVYSEPLSR